MERQNEGFSHLDISKTKINNTLNGSNVNTFDDKTERKALKSEKTSYRIKEFCRRESVFTELFRNKHISTSYRIFLAFLILFFVICALQDIVQFKIPKFVIFDLIAWNFRPLPLGILIWFGMQSTTLLLYYVYCIWSRKRFHLDPYSRSVEIWDATFLFLTAAYQVLFLVVPAALIIRFNIAISLSLALLMEQIRFLMKTHAFLRYNVPRVLNFKNSQQRTDTSYKVVTPSFNKYLYFLFAPTLIYRDEYPRTDFIRWEKVITHFLNVLASIFYMAFLMEKYLTSPVKDFGKEKMTPEKMVALLLENSLPALLFFILVINYCLLHSWLNAFAEMLRFADKMFYEDWWNSSSFAEYYSKWNTVVHDWLYAYIYKDAMENLATKKSTSAVLVFLISALFHEYILAFSFKFCYPVLFIFYAVYSTVLYFLPKGGSSASRNFFGWLQFSCGPGMIATLYMLEYYARMNCPSNTKSPIRDFFIPRSWTCNVF